MKTTCGRRWLALFLTLAMCLTLCPMVWADEGDEEEPTEPTTPTISLSEDTLDLYVGESKMLTATVENEVEGGTVKWSSDKSDIAAVDENDGTVTAKAGGTAVITATYTYTYTVPKEPDPETPEPAPGEDDPSTQAEEEEQGETKTGTVSASCTVTVKPAVTGITATISPSTLSVVEKGSEPLPTPTVKDNTGVTVAAADYTVEWTSGNVSIATVSSTTVTGEKAGTVKVTGTVKYKSPSSGKELTDTVTCTVTVKAKMNDISLSQNSVTMDKGAYVSITATPDPADATVKWTAEKDDSGDKVVDVPKTGKTISLYGVKPGQTIVTATIGEGSNIRTDKIDVTVSGLVIDTTPITVYENKTEPLPEVLGRYGAAENGTINWTSSNPDVAQRTGNSIAGRSPGTATITADVRGGYQVSVTVTVKADTATTIQGGTVHSGDVIRFSDFTSKFSQQAGYSLSHLTGIYVDPSQGTLYYSYISPDEPGEGVAQRDSYYYSPGSGQKDLKKIVFVPNSRYEGGQVTINYTVVSRTNEIHSARILLNVDQSKQETISLTTSVATPVYLNGDSFDRLCLQTTGAQLDYVIFSLPPSVKGTLYTDYVAPGNYGSRVTSGGMYRRADLDRIAFVPASGVPSSGSSEVVTIYYTARGAGSYGTTYNGKVDITVVRENVAGTGGPVYNIAKGATQLFDDDDFNDYCCDRLGLDTLRYVQFDSLPSSSQGTLYLNYRSASSTGSRVQTGTSYYYGTSRTPRLDRITFVPADGFVGSVRVPFTGWDEDGNRFSGNVEINVMSDGGTGSIHYSCIPGRTVSFTLSHFTTLSRDLTGRSLSYIVFQDLPDRYTQGSLYHNTTRVNSTTTRYYNTSGTYKIQNLSFQAASGFTGSVEIPFLGYTTATGVTFTGVIIIDASDGGNGFTTVTYYTDYSTPVVFNRTDFNEISKDETGYGLSSIKFSVPAVSRGDLYRNYRSTSSKGTRISSATTSISYSSLSQVAFVPTSGFVGTVYIDYTATASSGGGTFTGTVEIQVEQPGAVVTVRYSTQSTPVDFKGEDFRRSGYTLSSIKFNALPSASQGKLYYQYTSATNYTRQAATGTAYRLSGTGSGVSLISDLTFVPRAGFTGTVTLPYTGTNSNNSTFDGQVIITVSPTNSVSRFADLNGYSEQQKAAVEYIYHAGITTGISDSQYGPELDITRGDLATMVYRAFGFSPSGNSWVFNDVPPNAYYAQAVNALYAKGIVSGVGNGDYAPTQRVTRQEALLMVQRAMQAVGWGAHDGSSSALSGYSDGGSVASWAQGAVSLGVQQGYLPMTGSTIAPDQALTRIDMAQLLHRVLTY